MNEQPGNTTGFRIFRIRSTDQVGTDTEVRFDLVTDDNGYWHRAGVNQRMADRVNHELDQTLDQLDHYLDTQDP